MREREQRIEIEAIADLFGATVEWEATRKGHIRATFSCGAKHRVSFVMARAHGGDWRAKYNNLAAVRRRLRELTT
jgi:hypothetical protein